MCMECFYTICPSGCPNAIDPDADREFIETCRDCGEDIYADQGYFILGGDYYHTDCYENAEYVMPEGGAIFGTHERTRAG